MQTKIEKIKKEFLSAISIDLINFEVKLKLPSGVRQLKFSILGCLQRDQLGGSTNPLK